MNVSIIVPTYCEANNLRALVPLIQDVAREASLDAEIIIVDDESGDGTAGLSWDAEASCPVRLISRTNERGLASAVLTGMRHARGDILVVMDADWSHPPEAIPQLAELIVNGNADFAIGSRYVEGGGVKNGWGPLRWLNSRVATTLVRPLTKAHDPLAGFFAISREKLESGGPINCIGYKIGLELMVKCDCRSVCEVPIQFAVRKHGQSKLGIRQQIEYLAHLAALYWFVVGRWIRSTFHL